MEPHADELLITDDATFADICRQLTNAGIAALDTEFERVRTYHAQIGLLQLGINETHCWLVDPLEISDWSPLRELLEDAATVKLLHSCEEDVELLARLTGSTPRNILDTQVAAAFAGLGFSAGYGKLVEKALGVSLEKGEQRSDWMRRPLSAAQLRYARADVAHLPALYEKLQGLLAARGHTEWCRAECEEIVANRLRERELFDATRFRDARKLTRQQLAAVQLLGEWREQTAIERDLPRNWVLKDDELLALVVSNPDTPESLRRIPDLQRSTRDRNSVRLLALLAEAARTPEADCPEVPDFPNSAQTRKLVQRLMDVARARARELDLPPELLAPRRRVQALVNTGFPDGPWSLPASLAGWRAEAVGEALLNALDRSQEGAA